MFSKSLMARHKLIHSVSPGPHDPATMWVCIGRRPLASTSGTPIIAPSTRSRLVLPGRVPGWRYQIALYGGHALGDKRCARLFCREVSGAVRIDVWRSLTCF